MHLMVGLLLRFGGLWLCVVVRLEMEKVDGEVDERRVIWSCGDLMYWGCR